MKKITTIFGLFAAMAISLSAQGNKLNVLFVMTDDQGYGDFSCTGNPYVNTPNVDKLASESYRFSNYHAGTTCAPTRAGLMTSMYNNKMGVWHTIQGRSLIKPNQRTIANVFQDNGYATGLFGKWHLGDNYPYRPFDRGFETTLWFKSGGVTQISDYWGNNYYDDTYLSGETPVKCKGYCTNVFFDAAMDFMQKNVDNGKNFFCYLAVNAPHGPFYVEDKYVEKFLPMMNKIPNPQFYGMVENMDENMGRLDAFLKKNDLYENTIVIFTTDNGTTGGYSPAKTPAELKKAKARAKAKGKTFNEGLEEKGWNAGMTGRKLSNFDGGHRVPFFMRLPSAKSVDVEQLFAYIDVAPTLFDLCEIKEDVSALDGISIKSVIDEPSKTIERYLVVDTQRDELLREGQTFAVLKGNWRYLGENALYDVTNDVGQKQNIAKLYPEVAKELKAVYDKYWDYISVENEQTYPLYLTAPNEDFVVLSAHDKHFGNIYTQDAVRSGEKLNPDSYWYVKVPSDGAYSFELLRWAPETALGLRDSAPAQEAIAGFNAPAQKAGKALKNISGGEIIIGDISESMEIPATQNSMKFENIELKAGEYKLFANLLLSNGDKAGAYFIKITKK